MWDGPIIAKVGGLETFELWSPYYPAGEIDMQTMPGRTLAAALVLPLALAGASVASTGCDLAMHHSSEKQTAEWRKTYDLQPGGRIEIRNINGKIDVEPSAGNSVEVVAEKSASGMSVEAAKEALGGIDIQDTSSPKDIRIV